MPQSNDGPPMIDLVYAAGYFDGEGCITVMRAPVRRVSSRRADDYSRPPQECVSSYPVLRVKVSSCDYESLCVFPPLFGGKVRNVSKHYKGRNGHQMYSWAVQSQRALDCLQKMLPYLRAKKPQAAVVLDGWTVGRVGFWLSDTQRIKRDLVYETLKVLKESGRRHVAA